MKKSGQYAAETASAGESELINNWAVTNRKSACCFFLVKLLLSKYFKTCPKHPRVSGLPCNSLQRLYRSNASLAQGIGTARPLLSSTCLHHSLLGEHLCCQKHCFLPSFSRLTLLSLDFSLVPIEAANRNFSMIPSLEMLCVCTCGSNEPQSPSQVCIKCCFLNCLSVVVKKEHADLQFLIKSSLCIRNTLQEWDGRVLGRN